MHSLKCCGSIRHVGSAVLKSMGVTADVILWKEEVAAKRDLLIHCNAA
jgi:hypothetical protein